MTTEITTTRHLSTSPAASSASASTSPVIFADCFVEHGNENMDAVLMCVTEALETKYEQKSANVTTWLFVLCGALVFVMQLGFAM